MTDLGDLALTDPIAAADVANTPAGGIAATDVQAALNELDTEKAAVGAAPAVHVHSGADITSGTVVDARIDAAIARDSEVTTAVAAEASARTTADGLLVAKSLYDANTVLAATTDDTPAALTVAASTFVGRKASGNIAAMTATEAKAVLAIVEADITLVDNTTDDVSTTKHGFAPKAPNDATKFLNGVGAYAVPASSGAPDSASYITTAAEAGLSAEKVLGTTVITTGLRSARPAAAVAGYLFFATDEKVLYRDTGAAWVPLADSPSRKAMAPTGAISETIPRWAANTAQGNLNTGRLALVPIWLPGDTTITSITYVSRAAGSALTHQVFGLFDDPSGSSGGSGYALLRGTSDDTSTAWGADTAKTLNLTSTYATVRSGFFYLGIMVTGTPPSMLSAAGGGGSTGALSLAPKYGGTSNTGLTALPNPATAPTAFAETIYYAYVS